MLQKSSSFIIQESKDLAIEFKTMYQRVAKRMGFLTINQYDRLPNINNGDSEYITLKLATPASSDKNGNMTFHRREMKVARHRRQVPYYREEFNNDDKFYTSDIDYMKMPSDEVMYGSPHGVIDLMPSMTRALIEDSTFFSGTNRLFRMVDPITQASSYLKGSNGNGNYEFSNGGGIDEEELTEWKNGGTTPSILMFARDIMPEHQYDEAQIVILEKGMSQILSVPESEDHQIVVLLGACTIEDKLFKKVLSCNNKILIEGKSLINISNSESTDTIIVIGKTRLESENNDWLDHAIESGYLDIYQQDSYSSEDSLISELDTSIEEDEDSITSEIMYNSFISEGIVPDLSLLSEDIPVDKNQQENLWRKETAEKINQEEWRIRRKYRKLLDMLSLKMDSPYFCKGFKAPGIQWQRIIQEIPSEQTHIAEQRKSYFEGLLSQAKSIDNLKKLFGEEKWICPNCNSSNSNVAFTCIKCKKEYTDRGGFYGKIRIKNAKDRDLAKQWSEQPQKIAVKDDNGNTIWKEELSEFHKKRDIYIQKLKEKKLSDEVIKRKVWHWFDRVGGHKEAIYDHTLTCKCDTQFNARSAMSDVENIKCPTCSFCGQFTKQESKIALNHNGQKLNSKMTEDSIWRQRRTEAFKELICTKSQWNTIYCQLNIQKKRIKMGEQLLSSRIEAYNELCNLFRDCETHRDLEYFKETAYRQEIDNLGKITKESLIDQVSFGDERRIMFNWNKRWFTLKESSSKKYTRIKTESEQQDKLAQERAKKIIKKHEN
jgi:hypothetical protein